MLKFQCGRSNKDKASYTLEELQMDTIPDFPSFEVVFRIIKSHEQLYLSKEDINPGRPASPVPELLLLLMRSHK